MPDFGANPLIFIDFFSSFTSCSRLYDLDATGRGPTLLALVAPVETRHVWAEARKVVPPTGLQGARGIETN